MLESNPTNSIITTNTNNNIEPLLIYNKQNEDNILNVKNKQLAPTNIDLSTFKEEPLKKVEDKTICCSRRRKFPKDVSALNGYFLTFSLFLGFSILMTICIIFSKQNPVITDSLREIFNYLILIIWISTIVSIISLTDTATTDPGRQRGMPIQKNIYNNGRIKKIVGGQKYSLKYCTTCHLIRDIRTFHCDSCGLCIEKHDHHCGYLSNCIGVYNYKKFFIFINIAFIHVSIILFSCVYLIKNFEGKLDNNFDWIIIFIIIILLFGGIFGFFVFWMIIQHTVTIITNRTTREFIKNKEYKVYDRGCKKNCNEALCRTSIKEL